MSYAESEQRTDFKTRGMWGLVGGRARYTESAFEGLKREILEEVGETSTFKKIIPLEMFTSNDEKFYFNTFVIAVEKEFIPKLNKEHSGYCWTAFECRHRWSLLPPSHSRPVSNDR